ncbi:MAG: hypothetical protein WDN48_16710 [Pseudolabrys sp.]
MTVVPIANMIASSGYEAAFLWFGLGQGLIVVIVSLLLKAPQPGEVPAPREPGRATNPARLRSVGSHPHPGVLGHVRDVRDGRRRRFDGDRAARAHRE